jgi:hypothetical protein
MPTDPIRELTVNTAQKPKQTIYVQEKGWRRKPKQTIYVVQEKGWRRAGKGMSE